MKFAIEVLTPLAEALKHAWKVLYPAFKDLMSVVWDKVKKFFKSSEFQGIVTPMLPYIAAALFGPGLLKALTVSIISSMGKSVFSRISSRRIWNRSSARQQRRSARAQQASSMH